MIRRILIVVTAAAMVLGLSSCKATEPFKDANVSGRNSDPAIIGTMPDGFNNWAFKCNGRDGVYTLFHGNSSYGGIAVVPDDAACRG